MNAFNIVDVSDGLATTSAMVSSLGIAIFATLSGDWLTTVVAACLLGGCLGFLRFNRSPARMYLRRYRFNDAGNPLGRFNFNG